MQFVFVSVISVGFLSPIAQIHAQDAGGHERAGTRGV
jgi:hypothetical protein